jgi:hypothetical protein
MGIRLERLTQTYEVTAEVGLPEGGGHDLRKFFSARRHGQRISLDGLAARHLLAGALADRLRVRELRGWLATCEPGACVSLMTDADVVEHVARRIATGELRLYGADSPERNLRYEPPETVDDAVGPEEVVESDFIVGGVEALSEPEEIWPVLDADPEPAEIQPSFDGAFEPVETESLDASEQAQAMREAAASGTPFCEECERARQAQAAGGGG